MVGTIVLARLLTPVDFGLVAMVTTFSLLLMNFGLNGFTEAIIQREDLHHAQVSTLYWINVALSLILTLFFIAIAPAIAWFFNEPRLKGIAIAIAFTIIFCGISTQHLALLKRRMQFYQAAIIGVLARLISVGISVALAYYGLGYWALVAGVLALQIVSTAGAWIYCGWRPGLPARDTGIGQLVRFALNTYGNFTVNYFTRNVDNLLVGWRFGSQSLGFYKKAYDLFVLPVSQISAPLTSVALSGLSRLVGDPEKYRKNYLNALSIISFVGMILGSVLTLVGKDLTLVLLGSKWDKAGEIFTCFGPGIGVMLIYGTLGWLHLSLGRADRWLRWGILESVITVLFFMIGLQYGPKGIAVAFVTSFYVLVGPGLVYAGSPIRLTLSSVLAATWKYYISSLLAGILSFYILYQMSITSGIFAQMNMYFRVIVASVLCSSIYFILVVALYGGMRPIIEFVCLLREMIPVRNKKAQVVVDTKNIV